MGQTQFSVMKNNKMAGDIWYTLCVNVCTMWIEKNIWAAVSFIVPINIKPKKKKKTSK